MEDYWSNPVIQSFIKENLNRNVSELALRYKQVQGVPIQIIIRQIQGKQKAKSKLPLWYTTDGILFPPTLNLEQSSSQITAGYKSGILKGKTLADLTGGFGVDATAFSKAFEKVFYVERNEELLEVVRHNFDVFHIRNVEVFQGQAELFLSQLSKVDCIYVDPARRDNANRKVFNLEDCEPDIVRLLPILLSKSDVILIKTSPLLDIKLALKALNYVSEVHVVAVENECKEVLYLIHKEASGSPDIVTINFTSSNQKFAFNLKNEDKVNASLSLPQKYIYEPNAAVLKAGAFNSISAKYNLFKLHNNSHLYTNDGLTEDFPGRKFEIKSIEKYDKKSVGKALNTDKANITARNFPDSVEKIRKKLNLKEGGEDYLFATTDLLNKLIIIIARKIE